MFKSILSRVQIKSQKGMGLAETLMAVAILGTSVVAFLVSLSVGSMTANEQNKETTAQGLAQTQMEYTKNYTYTAGATTYPVLAVPTTYSVTVGVASVSGADTNIQKITVSVLKDSVNIVTISDYKVKR